GRCRGRAAAAPAPAAPAGRCRPRSARALGRTSASLRFGGGTILQCRARSGLARVMTPDSRRPSDARLGATGCIILPASLFIGLMIASAGTAIYPRVAAVGAALLCSGEVIYESHGQ